MPDQPRLILFALHFPPSREVGALRAAKVAEAFATAGVDVQVITVPHGPTAVGSRAVHPRITVHSVRPKRSPREMILSLRHRRGAPSTLPAAAEPSKHQGAPKSNVNPSLLKRFFYSLLWLPDDVQGFIPVARSLAIRLCREGRPVLYSTAPPFSPHLAALLTKWRTGSPLILEFRDPWVDNPQKPAHVRTWFTDRLDAGLERLCLHNADLIVAVSEGIHRLLDRGTAHPTSVVTIRNGIESLTPADMLPPSPFVIAHTGTCSYGRDPRPFLQALATCIHDLQLDAADVEAHFLGDCASYDGDSLPELAKQLGIAGSVHFRGWVPREEALDLVRRSHLLLLLAQSQPDQVPNKLYEYLGVRRPILAFADAGGEVANILTRFAGHGLITDNSAASAVPYLRKVLENRSSISFAAENELLSLTTSAQMHALVGHVARQAGWDPIPEYPNA